MRCTKGLVILFLSFYPFFTTHLVAQESILIKEAKNKERQGKIDEAITDYEDYISEHPGDLRITVKLVNLLFREKRYNDIITTYALLTDELKSRREIIAALARAYLQLGQKRESYKTFRSIISNEGYRKNSYSYVGSIFLSMGIMEEAKRIFLEGRKRWGNKTFSRELYLCYRADKDYKKALREIFYYYEERESAKDWVKREIKNIIKEDGHFTNELEKVVLENRNSEKLVGEIFLETGEIGRAKKCFLHTSDTESQLNFASLCIKKEYYKEAEDLLLAVANNNASNDKKEKARYYLAITYEGRNRFDDAIEVLNDIINKGNILSDSAIIRKSQILVYKKKEFDKGVKVILPLLKKGSGQNRDKIITIAITGYIKSGKLGKAEDLLRNNKTEHSPYLMAEVLFLKGNYNEAKKGFLRAVSGNLAQDFANDCLERIMIMERLKEKPAFLSFIRNVEEMLWKERYENAIMLINSRFNDFTEKEERAVLLLYKGKLYSLMGSINKAIASYTGISNENVKNPFCPKGLYRAALLYRDELKKWTMAGELFKRIIFRYPDSVESKLARKELEYMEKKSEK